MMSFDGDINRDRAFAWRFHDDGIEIERTELSRIRQREITEPDQEIGKRLHIAARAASCAGEKFGALDAVNHGHGVVARQRAIWVTYASKIST